MTTNPTCIRTSGDPLHHITAPPWTVGIRSILLFISIFQKDPNLKNYKNNEHNLNNPKNLYKTTSV